MISSNEVIFNESYQWLNYDPTAPFRPLNRPPATTSYPDEIEAIEKSFTETAEYDDDDDDKAIERPLLP